MGNMEHLKKFVKPIGNEVLKSYGFDLLAESKEAAEAVFTDRV